jgi:hypothetical protein
MKKIECRDDYKISVEEIENIDYYQTHSLGARIFIEGPEIENCLVLHLNTEEVRALIFELINSL